MINIFDLHNDYFMEIKSKNKKDRYLLAQNKNGLKNIISAIWTTELKQENQIFSTIENCKKYSIEHNINFSVEDLHFVTHQNIDELIKLKPIYAGLVWNNSNSIAGGAYSVDSITKFGENIINKLENSNIQIDTAHLNEKSYHNSLKHNH